MWFAIVVFWRFLGILTPLFAAALPIANRKNIGWLCWAISVVGAVGLWASYFGTNDIAYTRGNTVYLDDRKPDFAMTAAMSSTPLWAFAMFLVLRKFASSRWTSTSITVMGMLAASIATYYSVFAAVAGDSWGSRNCTVVKDPYGHTYCEKSR